ncbi:hypothetical protein HPB47_006761, partial [Ixodes persulcatus]
LGLWEEDMTKEQKLELLKVVAMSKETAKMEEAVRNSHFSPSSSAEWFGSGAHAIAPSSPLSHTSPKQKVEEVTLECEEGVLPPSPEKLDAPGTLKRQPNNSPQAMYDDVDEGDEWYGGFRARQGDTGRGRQLYSSLQSRPVKAMYAMEHRVLLEWQRDIPELKDKRFQDVEVANADEARDNPWARALSALHTSQRVPLFCPPGSDPRDHAEAILESFAAFHASLREQQRDPTLPLRAWGAPVTVGNHAKGTLDAATSRRAGRGDGPSSFEEFPPLSGKPSNRESRPPEKEERPPEKEGPPVERSPRPTSFAAAVASARPPLAGSWSPKRPREPEQTEVEEDDAGKHPSPCCSAEVADPLWLSGRVRGGCRAWDAPGGSQEASPQPCKAAPIHQTFRAPARPRHGTGKFRMPRAGAGTLCSRRAEASVVRRGNLQQAVRVVSLFAVKGQSLLDVTTTQSPD